jgi:ketosteroid isomerase-like protein
MTDDERAIRELFAAWQRAAAAGDGDWAHCWCRLTVTMTPLRGGEAERRSGHTLTVLRKLPDGAWVVARDAKHAGP